MWQLYLFLAWINSTHSQSISPATGAVCKCSIHTTQHPHSHHFFERPAATQSPPVGAAPTALPGHGRGAGAPYCTPTAAPAQGAAALAVAAATDDHGRRSRRPTARGRHGPAQAVWRWRAALGCPRGRAPPALLALALVQRGAGLGASGPPVGRGAGVLEGPRPHLQGSGGWRRGRAWGATW